MLKVYVAAGPVQAHIFQDLLAAEGIEAVIQGEDLFGMRGELPLTNDTLPSIWVNEADYERARELVLDFEEGENAAADGAPWTCPECGETLESQFTVCWKCGAERPLP
ncbi:MAG: DUF2007 domain-containing protein [Chloroflexota bacterium]|nr:DUF2007 domain-containing protein [Anaerolineales bacterium]